MGSPQLKRSPYRLWKQVSDYDVDPNSFRLASGESVNLIAASFVAMRHAGLDWDLETWCRELTFLGNGMLDGDLNERELESVRCEVENLDPDLVEEDE